MFFQTLSCRVKIALTLIYEKTTCPIYLKFFRMLFSIRNKKNYVLSTLNLWLRFLCPFLLQLINGAVLQIALLKFVLRFGQKSITNTGKCQNSIIGKLIYWVRNDWGWPGLVGSWWPIIEVVWAYISRMLEPVYCNILPKKYLTSYWFVE